MHRGRRDPSLTTKTASFAGCLDYLFVSPQHWEVVSTLDMPFAEPHGRSPPRDPLNEVRLPPLPNGTFPSYHLSLAAMLRLRG